MLNVISPSTRKSHRQPFVLVISCRCSNPKARSGLAMAVTRFENQNNASLNGSSLPVKKYDIYNMRSGMKPPCSVPRSTRHSKNDVLPLSQNWEAEIRDHAIIWHGIQTSGPRRLEISCEGSSAIRNAVLTIRTHRHQ